MRQSRLGRADKWRAAEGNPPLGVDQTQVLRHDSTARIKAVEITQLVRLVIKSRIHFVAQSQVKREISRDFPIVLYVPAIVVAERLAIGAILSNLYVDRKPQEEIHQRVYRSR